MGEQSTPKEALEAAGKTGRDEESLEQTESGTKAEIRELLKKLNHEQLREVIEQAPEIGAKTFTRIEDGFVDGCKNCIYIWQRPGDRLYVVRTKSVACPHAAKRIFTELANKLRGGLFSYLAKKGYSDKDALINETAKVMQENLDCRIIE